MSQVEKQRKMSQNRTLGQRSKNKRGCCGENRPRRYKCTMKEHFHVADLILLCRKRISLNLGAHHGANLCALFSEGTGLRRGPGHQNLITLFYSEL